MNKIILMGRLTKEVEVKQTKTTGTIVAHFSLAVSRRFVQAGEERQVDFFNIVAFAKNGEFCAKHFKKGQQVAIVGRVQNRTWEDENKVRRYATEIVVEEAHFADSKNKDGDTTKPTEEVATEAISNSDDLPF